MIYVPNRVFFNSLSCYENNDIIIILTEYGFNNGKSIESGNVTYVWRYGCGLAYKSTVNRHGRTFRYNVIIILWSCYWWELDDLRESIMSTATRVWYGVDDYNNNNNYIIQGVRKLLIWLKKKSHLL